MKRLAILVEGPTEYKAIKELFYNVFIGRGLFIEPIIVQTNRSRSGKKSSGGYTTYSKIRKEILRLLDSFDYVSTFFDYYGLNENFPCYLKSLSESDIYKKVEIVEDAFAVDIKQRKFIPYIQLHEFESLLYSDISGFAEEYFDDLQKVQEINKIIQEFPNPEEINNSVEAAPSQRIKKIFGEHQFKKTSNGINIVKTIGLETLLAKCKHFKEWYLKLESIVEE